MSEYIERERIEKSFDGIYDCADLIFEPHDQCCAADDCAHCKWFETKNAIRKRILSIPAADVRPVRRGEWLPIIEGNEYGEAYQTGCYCSECNEVLQHEPNYCPNCGARMEES